MTHGDPSARNQSAVKHGAGFLASGLIATATDAGMLLLLTRGAALDPFTARLLAIACAMVAGYFAHRRLTFAVAEAPSLSQFGKFVSVAASTAALNYLLYAAILLAWPDTEPLLAMLAPAAVAMLVSYFGLRFGVFRNGQAR